MFVGALVRRLFSRARSIRDLSPQHSPSVLALIDDAAKGDPGEIEEGSA